MSHPPSQLSERVPAEPAGTQPVGREADSALEDWELIRGIGSGDSEAWSRFFERWHSRMRAYARTMLRDTDLADDAVSDATLTIVRHAREGRLPPSANAVIGYVLARTRIAAMRQRPQLRTGREPAVETASGWTDEGEPPDEDDDEVLEERRTQVNRALRQLPPRNREAVLLHYIDQLSYREIAEIQGGRRQAASNRVHQGVLQLVAAIHARKRTSSEPGAVLPLSREERAHILDTAAQIRARNPQAGLDAIIKEVCRKTGIFIGRESRLITLLGERVHRRSS